MMARMITTSDILNAYDAFDGDVEDFIHAWDSYLTGTDTPCVTIDGLHRVTEGSCDECGSKNR